MSGIMSPDELEEAITRALEARDERRCQERLYIMIKEGPVKKGVKLFRRLGSGLDRRITWENVSAASDLCLLAASTIAHCFQKSRERSNLLQELNRPDKRHRLAPE